MIVDGEPLRGIENLQQPSDSIELAIGAGLEHQRRRVPVGLDVVIGRGDESARAD